MNIRHHAHKFFDFYIRGEITFGELIPIYREAHPDISGFGSSFLRMAADPFGMTIHFVRGGSGGGSPGASLHHYPCDPIKACHSERFGHRSLSGGD